MVEEISIQNQDDKGCCDFSLQSMTLSLSELILHKTISVMIELGHGSH